MGTATLPRTKAPVHNSAASWQGISELTHAPLPAAATWSSLAADESVFTSSASIREQMNHATLFGHQPFGQTGSATVAPIQAKSTEREQTNDFTHKSGGVGSSLPQPVLQKMEAAFGTNFSDVRIHESPQAQSIGAAAYTQGKDIHFAPGQYSPNSLDGQALLGHELTHVIQQRAGRVPTPQGKGVPINADPGLEAEADQLGAKAARGESVQLGSGLMGGGLVSPSMKAPPVQCGLFKKIGRGLKKVGKGIGSAAKGAFKGAGGFLSSLMSNGLPGMQGMMPGMGGGGMPDLSNMGGLGSLFGSFGGGGMGGMNSNIMKALGSGSNLFKDLLD
ncbi:MAG: DUF4157 domain-containing protein [Cyanobacteria bacterium P01_H01_bin.105]